MVAAAGLRLESVRYNPGEKKALRALRALDYFRRLDPLERYGTVGIYAVLGRDFE
jgi:hypothetical protein